MKCPRCGDPDLMMSERQGVEIDFCPRCRGVWLDRGELDKIVERSRAYEEREARDANGERGERQVAGYEPRDAVPADAPSGGPYDDYARREQDYQRHRSEQYQDQYYRKRKSFWEELFD